METTNCPAQAFSGWPFPPAGDLRLVAQWTDMGMAESSITLDGTRFRDAAAGAQKYWPEEDGQHD